MSTVTSHRGLITHSRGRTSIACRCGYIRPKLLRYIDPDAVFASHLESERRIDLQEHFAQRRGA